MKICRGANSWRFTAKGEHRFAVGGTCSDYVYSFHLVAVAFYEEGLDPRSFAFLGTKYPIPHACTTRSPSTFSNGSKSRSRCNSRFPVSRQNVAIQQSTVFRMV